MTSRSLLIVSFACGAAFACNGDGLVQPTPSVLNGEWTRLDEVPGSSEHWTLTVSDTLVTGAGTWTGEACCSGTLTVAGHVSRDSLHVDVTLITVGTPRPAFHVHFDGALQTPELLVGTALVDGFATGPMRLTKDG